MNKLARTLIPVLALACLAHANAAAPSNKWRIEFDDRAQTAGVIVFKVLPAGGAPIEIQTNIPAGTLENDVAGLVRDSLAARLGADFSVEVDDGEDVLIKKSSDAANFGLELVSSSATGLEIELERE